MEKSVRSFVHIYNGFDDTIQSIPVVFLQSDPSRRGTFLIRLFNFFVVVLTEWFVVAGGQTPVRRVRLPVVRYFCGRQEGPPHHTVDVAKATLNPYIVRFRY